MPARPLRVATLNIWGRHGDWPQRRDLLRSEFAALVVVLLGVVVLVAFLRSRRTEQWHAGSPRPLVPIVATQ
jgi:hypothetical protein